MLYLCPVYILFLFKSYVMHYFLQKIDNSFRKNNIRFITCQMTKRSNKLVWARYILISYGWFIERIQEIRGIKMRREWPHFFIIVISGIYKSPKVAQKKINIPIFKPARIDLVKAWMKGFCTQYTLQQYYKT